MCTNMFLKTLKNPRYRFNAAAENKFNIINRKTVHVIEIENLENKLGLFLERI